ncbi:gamma-glutamyltranspeptidase [Annulohypoxylon maeteangense]|uniref:gamma-glutamyltranspeptidase n=1 Tax=Annulohypoxylon maeteangense TaxID=1927788 RepID=UPI0020086230|nr:gamma-glutamyltranspeptidase [Annulohypoxylon maeteangense]KAI0882671.1 gamma-glutamyltranspeptidase [Annulohypoxylon maeteangense]
MRNLTSLPRSLLLLLLAVAPSIAAPQQWQPAGQSVLQQQQPSSSGKRGAVASESKVCSQIGIDLLAQGGNAVDAWIGTQLCVGVIGMYHSGLGGGGFALIRDSNGNYTVIDYRESAPSAASENMYKDNVIGSVFGGLSVGVPGELRGLEYAHKKFGALPWKDVVSPAADVAERGFTVSADQVRYMEFGLSIAGWNFLTEDPSWAEDFAPNGTLVKLGDVMTRKRYAETLKQIAKYGPDVFYNGPIAEATVKHIQKHNGTMTLDDMSSYEAIIREPISISYRGFTLVSSGTPSSGAVCLSTLKTMEGYSASSPDTNLTLHRFDESMRFAYGAHQALGDPAFVPHAPDLEAVMLSPSHASSIRSRIHDDRTQPVENYDPAHIYVPTDHGTSHISTADGSGIAVSSTTTVNLLFGSLLMVPETGVVLNDEMNDFSIPGFHNEFGYAPSPANYVRAGKRPLSSITPVIVERPSPNPNSNTSILVAVAGAAGGSRIISSTTQVLWHMLEHSLSPHSAVSEPRFHDQLMPNVATFEYGFDNATIASMRDRGHNVTWVREGFSAVQAIRVGDDGVFEAASETRQSASGGLVL